MDNSATIELKQTDFNRFMEKINKKLRVIKLEDSEEAKEVKKEVKKEEKKEEKKEDEDGTKLCLFYKKESNFSAWY
jgi:hypothetical protein